MTMQRLIVGIGVLCAAAIAVAQHSVRVGSPLEHPNLPNTISNSADADQPPGHQSSPDTVVLEAQLPKRYFDAGEQVILTTHLHTRGGADVDGGDVQVDDQVAADAMDPDRRHLSPRKGQAKGKGQHQVVLDNSPGDHYLTVQTSALDRHGNSIHRATADFYTVATGEIRFIDIGTPHPVGSALVVPLKAVSPKGGSFNVSATLASGETAVARADTFVNLKSGATTIDLYFQQSDIVEPGPYRLANVTATGGNAGPAAFAAVPHDVGQTFQAAHAAGEPPPHRNEQGEFVGGPYGPPADVANFPTPATPAPHAAHLLQPGEAAEDAPDPMPFTPPQ